MDSDDLVFIDLVAHTCRCGMIEGFIFQHPQQLLQLKLCLNTVVEIPNNEVPMRVLRQLYNGLLDSHREQNLNLQKMQQNKDLT